MTNDFSNLSLSNEYHGPNNISIANGDALSITHNGTSSLSTNSHTFKLQQLLCVPSISTNLLSVHKLCLDSHCIFDANMLQIHDIHSGKILYQGHSNNGLYLVHVSSTSQHPVFKSVQSSSDLQQAFSFELLL